MSKVGNAIKMLILLCSRGKMKIKDLAKELEISERMVRQYKDDFEQAGIYINSIPGPEGGYLLENAHILFNVGVAEHEYVLLTMLRQYLKHSDFIYTKELEFLLDKLNVIRKLNDNQRGDIDYFYKYVRPNCDHENERKKILDINRAIITKQKVKMDYFSLTSGLTNRVVRPYAIFQYKGDIYLAGYCEFRKKVLDFKFIRIKDYKILGEKFEIPEDFKVKDVLESCIGIYKDSEVSLKLKIKKPLSYIVSEKIWVDNQKIEWLEDESIIFTAKMRGVTEVKSWILSMGMHVEVLEPQSLREEIVNELKKLAKIYNF